MPKTEKANNERRKATRVSYRRPATLRLPNGMVFRAQVKDLSLKGALFTGLNAGIFHPGQKIRFEIELLGLKDRLTGIARLVWKDMAGKIGVSFVEINLKDLGLLRKIIELNFGDADSVADELRDVLG